MTDDDRDPETRSLHGGQEPGPATGARTLPVNWTSLTAPFGSSDRTIHILSALHRCLPNPVEAQSRALVKTLLYRVLMIAITTVVTFVVTGSTSYALTIGFTTNLVKTGTYYFYERLWARVSWGIDAH